MASATSIFKILNVCMIFQKRNFSISIAISIISPFTLGVPAMSRILTGDSQKLSFSTVTKVSSDLANPVDTKLLPT